jgi:hypothetical protein
VPGHGHQSQETETNTQEPDDVPLPLQARLSNQQAVWPEEGQQAEPKCQGQMSRQQQNQPAGPIGVVRALVFSSMGFRERRTDLRKSKSTRRARQVAPSQRQG